MGVEIKPRLIILCVILALCAGCVLTAPIRWIARSVILDETELLNKNIQDLEARIPMLMGIIILKGLKEYAGESGLVVAILGYLGIKHNKKTAKKVVKAEMNGGNNG